MIAQLIVEYLKKNGIHALADVEKNADFLDLVTVDRVIKENEYYLLVRVSNKEFQLSQPNLVKVARFVLKSISTGTWEKISIQIRKEAVYVLYKEPKDILK